MKNPELKLRFDFDFKLGLVLALGTIGVLSFHSYIQKLRMNLAYYSIAADSNIKQMNFMMVVLQKMNFVEIMKVNGIIKSIKNKVPLTDTQKETMDYLSKKYNIFV